MKRRVLGDAYLYKTVANVSDSKWQGTRTQTRRRQRKTDERKEALLERVPAKADLI